MTKRIGFIGAGMMGSGICKSLLRAGYPVAVIAHRNRAPIDELIELGAQEAKSTTELAASADIIMLCVDRAETVEAIMAGLASGLRSGQYVIDVTTGKPETSTKLASSLAAQGVTYIDAPVTGGPVQAAAGQLASMVGADPAAFEAVKPVLDAYSAQTLVFGPTGAGITAKLLNNFVTQSSVQIITQAYRAARRNGVDWEKLYNTMLKGAARSGSLERIISAAIKGDYKGQQFSIANVCKDIDYAGALVAGDPDGARIQAAILGALQRPVNAGLGDRFVSEMLDPEVERQAS
jgi:3-hydroxyisobutyrate dehydrogenase-like beta-hydroxyacid dehydrogenase